MASEPRQCELPDCAVEVDHRHRPHEWFAAGYCPGPNHRGERPRGLPTWCPGHVAKIAVSLSQLPRYAEAIPAEYARRTQDVSERIGKAGKAAHAPSPSADVDMLDEVARFLHRWTVDSARFLGHVGPQIDTLFGVPDIAAALTHGHRYLAAQWPTLAERPGWPIAFGLGSMNLAGRLELWLRQDDPVSRLEAKCPVCAGRRLRRLNGASQVDCPDCGTSWPEEHYELFSKMQAEDHTPRRRAGVSGSSRA